MTGLGRDGFRSLQFFFEPFFKTNVYATQEPPWIDSHISGRLPQKPNRLCFCGKRVAPLEMWKLFKDNLIADVFQGRRNLSRKALGVS